MSARRLMATTVVMGMIAAALAVLTPSVPEMADAVLAAQRTADTVGAETLLVAAAGLLAWGAWGWGALGLLLTVASALPGTLGSAADLLVRVLLPSGARRGAALALGLGLAIAGPGAGATLLVVTASTAAAAPAAAPVPDWPITNTDSTAAELPDWPDAQIPPTADSHVVVRGDCLWDIAGAQLAGRLGRSPTGAEIARTTHAWWTANAEVIGPDPDVLLPGQVLRPPL